ncbi:TPA: helix-turn-helix domain-containing protein [Raoultella planticola]
MTKEELTVASDPSKKEPADDCRYREIAIFAINNSGKTQATLAKEIGYEKNANNISMIKARKMHLSEDKVIPLAKACGIDADGFMMLYLEDRHPVIHDFIVKREAELIRKLKREQQESDNPDAQ